MHKRLTVCIATGHGTSSGGRKARHEANRDKGAFAKRKLLTLVHPMHHSKGGVTTVAGLSGSGCLLPYRSAANP